MATIRDKGVRLLKKLTRLGLWLLVAGFLAASVLTSVQIPGMPGSTGLPDVPKVDQQVLDKAAASDAGKQLQKQGFTPKATIEDKNLVAFFDEQEKHFGVANPGPYVIFNTAATKADKPDPGTPPDVIVDATNQVMVGLYQTYSNQRGAACYTSGDIRTLSSQWVNLNVFLWHKSLDLKVPVTPTDLPQLPASLGTVNCYTFVS